MEYRVFVPTVNDIDKSPFGFWTEQGEIEVVQGSLGYISVANAGLNKLEWAEVFKIGVVFRQ